MSKQRASILLLTLVASGCSHLEQAPLVYSSKTTVGIDMSTTSAQTPGLSINVGFKQVDAAYVPVAVARACPDAPTGSAPSCTGDMYQLKLIGGNSATDKPDSDGAATDTATILSMFDAQAKDYALAVEATNRARQVMNEAEERVSSLSSQIVRIEAKQAKFAQLAPELQSLRNAATSAGTESSMDEASIIRINEIEAHRPTATDLGDLARSKSAIEQASTAHQASIQKHEEARSKEETQRKLLAQAREAISRIERSDAYSVFGSFESTSGANTNGNAEISLGKIFATGVASQSISDGLSDMYRSRVAHSCFQAIQEKTDKAETSQLITLMQICRSATAGHDR